MSAPSVVIASRFQGPDGSAQGGYACGIVAAAVGNPAEVRLRRPPPLGRRLELEESDGVVLLVDPEAGIVAEGRAIGQVGVTVPAPVLHADAQAGAEAYLERTTRPGGHPFPRCFGCGPARAPGDGLRLFAGPVPGRPGIFATPWVPDPSLTAGTDAREETQGNDEVPDVVTWAALDCPTGAPVLLDLPADRAIVLGTMAAHVVARPRVGYRYVVMSWLEERLDRVAHGGAALLGERGDTLAVARGTWVFVDRDRFEGR